MNFKKTLESLLLIGLGSFNFSLGQSNSSALQSFENIRYSDSRISYKIEHCSIETKANILKTIRLLEEKTILDFYEVNNNEKLIFKFEYAKSKRGDGAQGTGGIEVYQKGKFRIIKHGEVNLEKSERCFNTVLHETLHALGFTHSNNPKDVMYPTNEGSETKDGEFETNNPCYKLLGEDIPKLINKLYSTSYYMSNQADLVLSKVILKRENDDHINLDVEIENSGLKNSEKSALNIYLNNKIIKTINIEELNIGSSVVMKFNVELKKNTPGKLKTIIENNFKELDKKNNEKIFDISQIK